MKGVVEFAPKVTQKHERTSARGGGGGGYLSRRLLFVFRSPISALRGLAFWVRNYAAVTAADAEINTARMKYVKDTAAVATTATATTATRRALKSIFLQFAFVCARVRILWRKIKLFDDDDGGSYGDVGCEDDDDNGGCARVCATCVHLGVV